jgi:hypothetical protein
VPPIDLRDTSDPAKLDPLALFKMRSVMLFPEAPLEREKFMAMIASETGVGKPRRSPFSPDEAVEKEKLQRRRGVEAGFLVLTCIQLHQNGLRPSFNNAVKILQHALPIWTSCDQMNYHKADHSRHLPRARRYLQSISTQYRRVAHLWAAYVHADQHKRRDILPESNETLPTFLGYAEAIAAMYRDLPIQRHDQRPLNRYAKRWRFKIPPDLVIRPSLRAEPLPDDWRAVITS